MHLWIEREREREIYQGETKRAQNVWSGWGFGCENVAWSITSDLQKPNKIKDEKTAVDEKKVKRVISANFSQPMYHDYVVHIEVNVLICEIMW